MTVDTLTGAFTWAKNNPEPGVYYCAAPTGKLFDFVVPAHLTAASIGISLSRLDSAWSPDSKELEAFFRFEQARKNLETKIDIKKSMRKMVAQATKNDSVSLKPIDLELNALLFQVDSLALHYAQHHATHLYARMLHAVRPPSPPSDLKPILKNGRPNSAFRQWMRQHYWDNTDFNDESLLRNTFWHTYFDNYFSRYVVPEPDSIITSVNEIINKTPRNGAFFRFVILRITQYYELHDASGADRIFVHMVDKYLKKGKTPWLDDATLERLQAKADYHRPNLTGSLAVNFTIPDENGKPVELYDIVAPLTVLVFYSPLCDHCMTVMPKLYQIFLDFRATEVSFLAINTDQEKGYWQKFTAQQHWEWINLCDPGIMPVLDKQYGVDNLPVIYLLDKQKRILAKRVKPNELGAQLAQQLKKK